MADAVTQRWQDRITRLERVPPGDLVPNTRNYRTHPDEQQVALEAALDRIGWVVPVIVNEATGRIVDGHLRAELAQRAGVDAIPVAYVSLTPDEEAAALLTVDPLVGLAGIDDVQFDALLRDVGSLGPDLDAMLTEVAEAAGLLAGGGAEAPEEFASYDEDVDTDYCCPKCGYEWSGAPR